MVITLKKNYNFEKACKQNELNQKRKKIVELETSETGVQETGIEEEKKRENKKREGEGNIKRTRIYNGTRKGR